MLLAHMFWSMHHQMAESISIPPEPRKTTVTALINSRQEKCCSMTF